MGPLRCTSLLQEVVGGKCVSACRCESVRPAGIYFQACLIDHSSISPSLKSMVCDRSSKPATNEERDSRNCDTSSNLARYLQPFHPPRPGSVGSPTGRKVVHQYSGSTGHSVLLAVLARSAASTVPLALLGQQTTINLVVDGRHGSQRPQAREESNQNGQRAVGGKRSGASLSWSNSKHP